MKIVDNILPGEGEVNLDKITIEYTQPLDCCQSEDEYSDPCQILTLSTYNGGGGKFIRINTNEAGWSINDIDEMVDILSDFKQRYMCESE